MVIRNKKSGATQEVDQIGWEKIIRAGWKDKYDIIDGSPMPASKAPTPAPPEIANFAKPIGNKQKAENKNTAQDQTTQQPAAGAQTTQGADEKTPESNG